MYLPGTAAVIDDAVIDATAAPPAEFIQVTAMTTAAPVTVVVRQVAAAPANAGPEFPCADEPDLFFAESPDDVELAKSLCGGCDFRASCLAGAIERREPWGVWGGQLFLRGEIVPRKRARGRPRKDEVAA